MTLASRSRLLTIAEIERKPTATTCTAVGRRLTVTASARRKLTTAATWRNATATTAFGRGLTVTASSTRQLIALRTPMDTVMKEDEDCENTVDNNCEKIVAKYN